MAKYTGRGQRPPNEFASSMKRRHAPRTDQTLQIDPLSTDRPMLRVARQVSQKSHTINDPWVGFLSHMAAQNKAHGSGVHLSTMEVGYVSTAEMDRMLVAKYPRDYETTGKTRALQRKVAAGIREFVLGAFRDDFAAQTDELDATNFLVRAATKNFSFSNEIDPGDDNDLDPGVELHPQETLGFAVSATSAPDDYLAAADFDPFSPARQTRFGPTILSVSGIEIFGSNGAGLDFKEPAQLFEEYDALRGYLRGTEKLNTSHMDRGWVPYAAAFNFDTPAAATLRFSKDVPGTIALTAPHTLVS